jgi:hypothetical protein
MERSADVEKRKREIKRTQAKPVKTLFLDVIVIPLKSFFCTMARPKHPQIYVSWKNRAIPPGPLLGVDFFINLVKIGSKARFPPIRKKVSL